MSGHYPAQVYICHPESRFLNALLYIHHIHIVIFKNKMKGFAAICRDDETDEPIYITLKLEPVEGEFYRKEYEDIIPGYYMNKVHWNSVNADGNVPDDVVKDLLDSAYLVVFNSLSKKKQKEILEDANGLR